VTRPLLVALALTLGGCQQLVCGPGTEEASGVCVPLPSLDDDDTSAQDDDDSGPDDDDGPVDPGLPGFPDIIDVLHVSVRTGWGQYNGTNSNELSFCLTADACFTLDNPDAGDFEVGAMDVFTWEGIDVPRADVDRIEIRSVDGSDQWRPVCLEVRFDGEPVYCSPMDVRFGNEDDDEVEQWADPEGLHNACVTCFDEPLTHGPMVGAVTDTTARLLFRTDATRQTAVRVGPAGGEAPVVAWAYPSASEDFVAEVEVTGLQAETDYVYRFEVDGRPASPLGRFRTAPAPGQPDTLRVAFGSCSKFDEQPAFQQIRFYEPDLFFFLGDNHYANSDDLGSLRRFYRWGLSREHRRQLLATTSTLATWDDHDFTGNNTDGYEPGKDVALRAFEEYWANPAAGTAEVPGVFFRHSWGDVDLFFVDDRYHREFDDSLLGAEQTAWLLDELAASTATFKLIVCGSQWTDDGSSDSWAAFPEARDAIFEFIAEQGIGGVVLLSGDVHRSELRSIDRTDAGGYDLPELTSSPLANSNFGCDHDDVELLGCVDDSSLFVTMDIDTLAADPTLRAAIVDEFGDEQVVWTILASELQVP